MEIDPMKVEKSSEQLIRWSSSSSDDQQRVDRVRLYRCTFCRRGFSNAQALGGHMNIHRKDRAKLREFSNDNNLLSLSVSEHPHRDDDNDDEEQPGSPSERPCDDHHVPKGNNNNNVLDEDPLLLPLFVETPPPAANNNGKESCCSHVELSDDGAPSASPAVDLELRLGVEPHQHDLEVINIPPPTNPGLISTSYTKQE